MDTIALLVTALLFGGMTLYSFGFAAFVFSALPADTAGPLIRRAFPHFYLFVLACSVVAGVLLMLQDWIGAAIMTAVALSTIYARQSLMPAINAATDAGQTTRFKWLHGLSVAITLAHILATGAVLIRMAGA
ncbi:MAG TPA: DUF4149 domain-containing protein [Roseovarius sp.]|nr:DUF4149 domain-containing protein [Roseovarius sp.]